MIKMMKLGLLSGMLAFSSISYAACGKLDYQEMLDLPDTDIQAEYCTAEKGYSKALDEKIKAIETMFNSPGAGQLQNQSATGKADACKAEMSRIKRILDKRGLPSSCKA